MDDFTDQASLDRAATLYRDKQRREAAAIARHMRPDLGVPSGYADAVPKSEKETASCGPRACKTDPAAARQARKDAVDAAVALGVPRGAAEAVLRAYPEVAKLASGAICAQIIRVWKKFK